MQSKPINANSISNGSKSDRVGSRESNLNSLHQQNVASSMELEREQQRTEKNIQERESHQNVSASNNDDDTSEDESTIEEEVEQNAISPEPLSSLSSVGRGAAAHKF